MIIDELGDEQLSEIMCSLHGELDEEAEKRFQEKLRQPSQAKLLEVYLELKESIAAVLVHLHHAPAVVVPHRGNTSSVKSSTKNGKSHSNGAGTPNGKPKATHEIAGVAVNGAARQAVAAYKAKG